MPRSVAVLLAPVVLLAACSRGGDGPQFATAEVTVDAVSQLVSSPATVVARTYAATVEAAARVDATAPVPATVARLAVADGDVVAAGDVLAVLTSDAAQVALRQAEAGVAAAGAALAAATTALTRIDERPPSDPLQFATRADELEVLLNNVAEDLAFWRGPAVASSQERQLRILGLLAEEQRLLAERDERTLQAAQVGSARAALVQAERALALARSDVAGLTLRAPVAGTVRIAPDLAAGGGRTLTIGSDVAPRQPVATVTAEGGLRIDLAVPEGDLAPVGPGVAVTVDLAAFPGRAVTGTVVRLDAAEVRGPGGTTFRAEVALDPTDLPLRAGLTGTATLPGLAFDARFEVELEVDEIDAVLVAVGQPVRVEIDALRGEALSGRIVAVAVAPVRDLTGSAVFRTRVRLDVPAGAPPALRGGLTGTGDVEVQRIEGALTVPSTALLRTGAGEVVFVVRDGVAVEVPVRVLAFGEARAAVAPVEGTLVAGERVVTEGLGQVRPGTVVDPR